MSPEFKLRAVEQGGASYQILQTSTAIGTPLIADSVDKRGKLGITVSILSMNRFAVLVVDNLKLASGCVQVKLSCSSNRDTTNMREEHFFLWEQRLSPCPQFETREQPLPLSEQLIHLFC